MQSSDARNLFQTEASLAQGKARATKAKRTAQGVRYGRPIWLGGNDGTGAKKAGSASVSGVALSAEPGTINGDDYGTAAFKENGADEPFVSLAGKDENVGAAFDGGKTRILSALLDPTPDAGNAHLFTAESGALLRRIDLESGLAVQLFRGHTAPVTALAILEVPTSAEAVSGVGAARRRILFSAGWDRSIRAWPIYDASAEGRPLPLRMNTPLLNHPDAASDFIKALLVVPSATHPVLLSGGSDRVIRIWSLARLQKLVSSLSEATWRDPSAASQHLAEALLSDGRKAELELMGTFGEHTRPITALEILPERPHTGASKPTTNPIIFSADSLGRIAQSELELRGSPLEKAGSASARLRPQRELKGTETSVGALHAGWVRIEPEQEEELDDGAGPQELWEARLWSASRDRTAHVYTIIYADESRKASRRPQVKPVAKSGRAAALQFGSQEPIWPEKSVTHKDYVTSVLDLNFVRRSDPAQPRHPPASAVDVILSQTSGDSIDAPALITACSDEQIRLWSLHSDETNAVDDDESRDTSTKIFDIHGNAAIDPNRPPGARLKGCVEGHWHEISSIGAWWRQPAATTADSTAMVNQGEWWIVSASYDGSVRRWSLAEFIRIAASSKVQGQSGIAENESAAASGATQTKPDEGQVKQGQNGNGGIQMTAEEEAELAELMGSDDDD
ncbi:hypothetical protein CF327_g5937 [Tilletia walkeri]|uniref:WD40 repeat-like protein n=1 Tax=Tilletia walkeri TaxID=117179 RepID=A0A8X7T424_9BASI|nr:hypothetical protein CF327_g5937 [Tilletia walkeri]KAE8267373.1 hypothetical protein A4X09_0g4969 [Tilletia walkeri]